MVAAIVREANPERIVLFGPAASATMHEASDVDPLVVPETAAPRQTARRLRRHAKRPTANGEAGAETKNRGASAITATRPRTRA